ncbi:hypothetical protein Patl1_24325 [Pistacia atlantica]|uniref:Uncharacterized protein n=1 Tax=Pistacia atlantica TaxID=434234 RepID=A0ACC0ZYV6_9ROSI|nr:hypothetical protein Patl1_24325 [Pistacia atlantica]
MFKTPKTGKMARVNGGLRVMIFFSASAHGVPVSYVENALCSTRRFYLQQPPYLPQGRSPMKTTMTS